MATGYGALALYVPTVIAPLLLAEFGWSKADFALVSALGISASLCMPFVGRLTDVLGVRGTALIGLIGLPVAFLAYAMMTGPIWQYVVIYVIQTVLCITTTATVYSRIPVQYIQRARGFALAIVASGPALTGAIGSPILNAFVENHGWRAGFYAMAAFCAVSAVITLLLLPSEKRPAGTPRPRRRAREDYPAIFRTHAFWILIGAMLLCNLPQIIALSQLKLILLDNGVTPRGAAVMLSSFAMGTLAGRFLAGLALDRFPAHVVGLVCMGLPSVGLVILASPFDAPTVLTLAVLCIGFSFGAEGDIAAYIVSRKFPVAVFSSVMGLVTMAMSASSASGAALLSFTLTATGGFNLFMAISAAAVFAGSMMFLLLADRHQAGAFDGAGR
ncbi:MAG: MFS transporter [Novosphingobium sp.]|jgi:predicted MFS family arabinose efflux permease|nr:MFS transporter [Novosphingobium sp.]